MEKTRDNWIFKEYVGSYVADSSYSSDTENVLIYDCQ